MVTNVGTILFSIIFLILFFIALLLICMIYVCDTYECKPFNVANNTAPPGTQDYVLTLLTELFNDGIWAFPFIGATLATLISLLLLGVPITIKNFSIMFLVVFIVTYFLFSFFGHHYIKPQTEYIANYIENNCENTYHKLIDPHNLSSNNTTDTPYQSTDLNQSNHLNQSNNLN